MQAGSGFSATTGAATLTIAVSLAATDTSTVTATAVGADLSIAVSSSGTAGSLAIGVSIANNSIDNTVSADLLNASVNSAQNTYLISTSTATINAVSVAASVSFAKGNNGVALSGGGAESENVILSTSNAFLENSVVTSGANVQLSSNNSSDITATVVAVSVALGFSKNFGLGISIGAAVSTNYIGYSAGSDVNDPTPAQVQAYAQNSSITATGNLTLSADASQETIDAVVVAVSAAISGSSKNSGALSGSGSGVENRVATDIMAFITNVHDVPVVGGPAGAFETTSGSIVAANVSLTAVDTSSITATSVGASVAGTYGATIGVALSIGAATASNEIRNQVAAYLLDVNASGTNSQKVPDIGTVSLTTTENATITATAVAVSLAAGFAGQNAWAISGAGAQATNVILTSTNAFIQDSTVASTGAVTINSTNTSTISATIVGVSVAVAGTKGSSGVGVSIGVALASNYVGWNPDATSPAADHTSDQELTNGLTPGTTVQISSGVGAGNVFKYLGPTQTGDVDLKMQDYFDPSVWQQLNLTSTPAQTEAYVRDSSIQAGGDLKATATASQTITAKVVAFSAALAGGSQVGVGLSGAGANATNKINMQAEAFIDGNGGSGIQAKDIALTAHDTSTITAGAGGASLAGAYGGTAGVAITIGVSLATDEIDNQVLAEIENAPQVVSMGTITLDAQEQAGIHAVSVAASLGVGLAKTAGVAVSGAAPTPPTSFSRKPMPRSRTAR